MSAYAGLFGLLVICQQPSHAESVRLPVTRDTWVSSVPAEAEANLGGAARLKLKSYQEFSLIDVDPEALRGRVINNATLYVRNLGSPPPRRVTVGTIGADWVEGTSARYEAQPGSSSFAHRRNAETPWTIAGSDLCSVILAHGGTYWRSADAFPPDVNGWQRIAIEPSVLAARVAGLGDGFVVFDDTGSEWVRDGERFEPKHFPNRYVASREAGEREAPYVIVDVGAKDREPPAPPTDLKGDASDLPAGEAWIDWTTPEDRGPAGTLGFFVRVNGKDLPRYLIPIAGEPGQPVRMHLRDLGLAPGKPIEIAVRAADAAGNVGSETTARIVVSDRMPFMLPERARHPSGQHAPLPQLNGVEVAIVDELDKLDPTTGVMTPPQPDSYLASNHVWNASTRTVRLHAARNEFVAFQVVLKGNGVLQIVPDVSFSEPAGASISTSISRYETVPTEGGPMPDPIVPLNFPTVGRNLAAGSRSLHVEFYVPHQAQAGDHTGRLRLRAGSQELLIPIVLNVWDFTLPDTLSFLPEMNCYGLPDNERDYYRLAHAHRTFLNHVPYSQSGIVEDGCAPEWDGERLDWSRWDKRFGPYLDGSAFADLPRSGVPIEGFYLPLHENWPTPMEGNYNGSYWADRAFPASYREAFVDVSRQMAEHFEARGWHETLFQGFLNNKNNFKEQRWSRGSSPWLLDEPASFQDFLALRFFGAAFHEGIRQAGGNARMVYRCDISRPQWQRDVLDEVLDYCVVSRAFRDYRRIVLDQKREHGILVLEYGSANGITEPNTQPAAWCLDVWSLGADGVVPWQTVGRGDSWHEADRLALFYPSPFRQVSGPLPSIRLKAFRRGQQDVEYLTLLSKVREEPRWAVGDSVRQALKLAATSRGTEFAGGEDAGVLDYGSLRPQDLWSLRVGVGQALSAAHPPARRRLVEPKTPPRDPSRLRPSYVSVGVVPEDGKPSETAQGLSKTTARAVIQGAEMVDDVLLDPDHPTTPQGATPRSNAIRKADVIGVFLTRFDLNSLQLPATATVTKATVDLRVWDPSSQGTTKVIAAPVLSPWEESTASWAKPSPDRSWKGGATSTSRRTSGPPGHRPSSGPIRVPTLPIHRSSTVSTSPMRFGGGLPVIFRTTGSRSSPFPTDRWTMASPLVSRFMRPRRIRSRSRRNSRSSTPLEPRPVRRDRRRRGDHQPGPYMPPRP